MFLELVIGKDTTSLFETVHALVDLKIGVAFGVKVFSAEVVGAEDL